LLTLPITGCDNAGAQGAQSQPPQNLAQERIAVRGSKPPADAGAKYLAAQGGDPAAVRAKIDAAGAAYQSRTK